MKVETKEVIKYNITDVDAEVVSALVSIILNSSRTKLNKYLESVGARPDVISEVVMDGLVEFGDILHKEMVKRLRK